jgi:GntR family transcriptional regulator
METSTPGLSQHANADTALTSSEPLFVQIQARVRRDILERRLLPGQKLPSEAQMQSAFGVSRITVRQALNELQKEGLVETVNGKGSFVTRPANAPRLGMLVGFNELLRSRGRTGRVQPLSVRKGPAPARVQRALGLGADARAVIVRELRLVDGVPAALARTFYAEELGREVLAAGVPGEDVMTVLEERLGFRLERTHIAATAVSADRGARALLGVSAHTPLLQMEFIPFDLTGRPLAYAEMTFRPDQFKYRAVVRR